jgi:hypothetical protein
MRVVPVARVAARYNTGISPMARAVSDALTSDRSQVGAHGEIATGSPDSRRSAVSIDGGAHGPEQVDRAAAVGFTPTPRGGAPHR